MPSPAGAGDRPELVGGDRVAGDHLAGHALAAHLAQDQAGLGVIAADIDHVDLVGLHLRDQRIEVLVALRVGLVHLLLHAGLVQRLLHLVGETFAVGRLVLKDGDVLALVVLGDVVAGHRALLVVAAADAERVPHVAFGEGRIGRGRRDLQHVAVLHRLPTPGSRTTSNSARRRTAPSRWRTSRPTARACFGSQASSPISSLSFLPITPPAALMSATAASAPFLSWVPNEAYWPVIGPATPMLMSWADAVPTKARLAPSATPASHIVFIPFSSSCGPLTSWSPRPR